MDPDILNLLIFLLALLLFLPEPPLPLLFALDLTFPSDVALLSGLTCLNLSERAATFHISSAERYSHFRSLHARLHHIIPHVHPFCSVGYCGPWLEDLWCSSVTRPFSDFGPFVPLFVPWLALWMTLPRPRTHYFSSVRRVLALLRPEYVYVTVSQHDGGVEGGGPVALPRNLLVLSAGGTGHVPLLLWLAALNGTGLPLPRAYRFDVAFAGSLRTHWVRAHVARRVRARLGARAFVGSTPDWRALFGDAKFVLAPRGMGRSSYRLGEVLQLGMVPVYVWDDIPWLPYFGAIRWDEIAVVLRWDEVDAAMSVFAETSAAAIREMRLRIRAMYDTHFSPDAVFRQMFALFRGGFLMSDLRCGEHRVAFQPEPSLLN